MDENRLHVVLLDFIFFAYAVQLANALSELCRVTLLLPEKAAGDYGPLLNQRVELRPFRTPARLRYPTFLLTVCSLLRTIRQLGPDVVHQLSWNPWWNLLLPLWTCPPLVTTVHDAARHPGDEAAPFQSWQWRRARRVIVHAEAIRQLLIQEQRVDATKIHVIPHGAYDLYHAWSGAPVPENDQRILFFGRIWEYKGLQHLIAAEPLITRRVPDARIVIAGEGEPFEKYERMMVDKDHFIVHNHHIPDDQVARLFQEAAVVVLPYTEASQSGVLAIAYSFGKPVVATRVGGIPEVVDDGATGYLVDPADPPGLAAAIVTLLEDPQRRREMGQRALARARGELSWAAIARQTVHVYQEAVCRS